MKCAIFSHSFPSPFLVLLLAFFGVFSVSGTAAAQAVTSPAGYPVSEYLPAPAGETLVSFDWDGAGALYYMTGAPYPGMLLAVRRKSGGGTEELFRSTSVFPGSRATAVGPFVYFNDGGDFGRYSFDYFCHNTAAGGTPVRVYDSSAPEALSLWGIDTRDGGQIFASGAVGFGDSSIFYQPLAQDGSLGSLVNLGTIGQASGPAAFGPSGEMYYVYGYSYTGQLDLYRWNAGEVAAAITAPALSPLNPAGHVWATPPNTFDGASGLVADAAGRVYVTVNKWGVQGELLMYRPDAAGAAMTPVVLARHSSDRLETLRIRDGALYVNCVEGIFSLPLPLALQQVDGGQVQAVAGKTANLAVQTVGGTGTIQYQWYRMEDGKADTPVGGNSPILALTPTLNDDGAAYYCAATDDYDTVNSAVFTLAVSPATPAAGTAALAALALLVGALGGRRAMRRV